MNEQGRSRAYLPPVFDLGNFFLGTFMLGGHREVLGAWGARGEKVILGDRKELLLFCFVRSGISCNEFDARLVSYLRYEKASPIGGYLFKIQEGLEKDSGEIRWNYPIGTPLVMPRKRALANLETRTQKTSMATEKLDNIIERGPTGIIVIVQREGLERWTGSLMVSFTIPS